MAQAALALAVLALGVDRLAGIIQGPPQGSSATSATTVSSADLQALDARLARLAEDEAASRQERRTQQEQMLAAIAKAQEDTSMTVAAVHRAVDTGRNAEGRATERLTQAMMSAVGREREQLRQELRSLAAANEILAKQVAALENSTVELKNRLETSSVDVSEAVPGQDKSVPLARKGNEAASMQIAGAAPENQPHPFTFWVSFQEGTSEESINRLMQEFHGQKGPIDHGWYPVEVRPPPPDPPDRFLDHLRHATIVRAVSRTHVSQSEPPQ